MAVWLHWPEIAESPQLAWPSATQLWAQIRMRKDDATWAKRRSKSCLSGRPQLEAAGGIEPPYGALQAPA
jgi:hypothetical protein